MYIVPCPGFPIAAFAASIAAEQSEGLVISKPAAHVAPSVVRTVGRPRGGGGGGGNGGDEGDGEGSSGGDGEWQ